MKSKYSLYALAILLVVWAIVSWLRPLNSSPPSGALREDESVHETNTIIENTAVPAETESSDTAQGTEPRRVSPWAAAQNEPEKRQQMFDQMIGQKNVPVHFYGKAVDQDGNPLSEVKIMLAVRQWYVQSYVGWNAEGKMLRFERTTGADGKFELRDVKGDAVDIQAIEKQGYQLSPKAERSYGAVTDPSSPVIFKMWKQGPQKPLVTGQKVFGIIPDGRVYTLDLLQGKKVEGDQTDGDLRVRIIRQADAKPRSKYQWSFSVEAIRGGLLQTEDEFMYLAPESGYESKISMELMPSDTNWTSLVKRQLFLRSRAGRVYGRLQVEVHAIYNDKSACEVNYAVNPDGSRNLQP